jgi:hypothetical protein
VRAASPRRLELTLARRRPVTNVYYNDQFAASPSGR